MSNASIAHEFYKVVDYWKTIEGQPNWKLAIWVVAYQDAEIVQRFLDFECSPMGQCKDIFFQFKCIYGDQKQYEQDLWKEFVSWFDKIEDENLDILGAMIKDGLLPEPFVPNTVLEPNIENLLSELERFRSSFKGAEEIEFTFFFNLAVHNPEIGQWYAYLINLDIPPKIRFTTIDLAEERQADQFASNQKSRYREIFPELDMVNAMKNEMSNGLKGENPHEPSTIYKELIIKMTDAAGQKKKGKVKKLIPKILKASETLDDPSSKTATFLLISTCFYMLMDKEQSLLYADQAVNSALELEQKGNDAQGYPLWRASILLKGSILLISDREEEGIATYKELCHKASQRNDLFYTMEGYRMCATFREKSGDHQQAFEYALLGLYAGAKLDEQTRKLSTFPLAMKMADENATKIPLSEKQFEILYQHFEEWLGKDWRKQIEEATSFVPTNSKTSPLTTEKIIEEYV